MKIKLSLLPVNGGPFNCKPACEVEIEAEKVLANDVIFPWEFNPHKKRLWVIGNEFGAMGAVWADHEQDALDILVDENLGAGILIKEEDADEESTRLGNAGEPASLDYCWLQIVDLSGEKHFQLLCKFAEARGGNRPSLDN